MKKNISPIILFAVVAIFNTGCEKEVTDIKLPSSDPKLVVGCFISPQDDTIKIKLTLSNPIFGSSHNNAISSSAVSDASVSISDHVTSAVIPYNAITSKYELSESNFQIFSGVTYYLTVNTPDGKSLSSSCTVPLHNLSITGVFVDSSRIRPNSSPAENGDDYYYLVVKWSDIANETNYYKTYAESGSVWQGHWDYDALYSYDGDAKNDLNASTYSTEYWVGYNDYFGLKQRIYIGYVMNIDENYYKYEKSIANYQYDDPFTEPVRIYSNIEGGLGVFGAYQKITITKQF